MSVFVVSPGFFTTIQDAGRRGMQQFGVPSSGVMDAYSAEVANRLVDNPSEAALLEITLQGPTLRFEQPAVIALTGAKLSLAINGKQKTCWESHKVLRGEEVLIGAAVAGSRAYLAISGGIDVPLVMGSRSTFVRGSIGGIEGRSLRRGDILTLSPGDSSLAGNYVSLCQIPSLPGLVNNVRVMLGPQEDMFTPGALQTFQTAIYTITNESDRMGYRLAGDPLAHNGKADILSDGIAPGSIQVPGHGQPIIMLSDRQSTGGYAKIATVIGADLPLLGQMQWGQSMRFMIVSREDALTALAKQRQCLEALPCRGTNGREFLVTVGEEVFATGIQEIPMR